MTNGQDIGLHDEQRQAALRLVSESVEFRSLRPLGKAARGPILPQLLPGQGVHADVVGQRALAPHKCGNGGIRRVRASGATRVANILARPQPARERV